MHHPQQKEVIYLTENIIIIEDQHYHKASPELRIISEELKIIAELVKIVDRLTLVKAEPRLVLTTIINNSKFQIMSVTLNVSQFLDGNLGLVDHATQQPIAATFTNETFVSGDETIFTASEPADDQVEITGVAEGTADLTVSADCTYIDSNTGQEVTKNKSVVIPVTITKAVSEEETDLVVNFGAAH